MAVSGERGALSRKAVNCDDLHNHRIAASLYRLAPMWCFVAARNARERRPAFMYRARPARNDSSGISRDACASSDNCLLSRK